MTSVATRAGKVILKNGKVGTETSCCCDQGGGGGEDECVCATLQANLVLRVTLTRKYGICGLIEFDNPFDVWVSGTLTCEGGLFFVDTDIDVSLCDPDQSCGGMKVFFDLLPPCNCENTSECTVEIAGWEEIFCTGGIENIEIV